jgi:hypothetical protein
MSEERPHSFTPLPWGARLAAALRALRTAWRAARRAAQQELRGAWRGEPGAAERAGAILAKVAGR